MDTRQKYVKVGVYDSIVIFPEIIQHKEFKNLNPSSAGFCYVTDKEVKCFGESISLGITSDEEDSEIATNQLFRY
jgi:hypothetical protein